MKIRNEKNFKKMHYLRVDFLTHRVQNLAARREKSDNLTSNNEHEKG